MILQRFPDVQQLSLQEKLELASELWEDVEAQVPVDPEIVALLNERHAEYLKDPSKVMTFEETKARILGQHASR